MRVSEFPHLGFFRVVGQNVLLRGVVQIDLAEERVLGVVEVAALGLDRPSRLARIFLFPFGDDVIVRFHFEQALEDERETLGGRLLERQNPDVVIVQAQMPSVTFEMRLAEVIVEERVVFEFGVFQFLRGEVQGLLEDAERLVFIEQANGQEVAHLQNEAFDFLEQRGLGFADLAVEQHNLSFR